MTSDESRALLIIYYLFKRGEIGYREKKILKGNLKPFKFVRKIN